MSDKNVLIITDGTESINLTAQTIKKLTKNEVKIISASDFTGTEILPVQVFFLGCENPNPQSFSYLADMLLHINLAGRKCGIFSVNSESLKYLENILKDCEAGLAEPLLVKDIDDSNLQKWLKGIIN